MLLKGIYSIHFVTLLSIGTTNFSKPFPYRQLEYAMYSTSRHFIFQTRYYSHTSPLIENDDLHVKHFESLSR